MTRQRTSGATGLVVRTTGFFEAPEGNQLASFEGLVPI